MAEPGERRPRNPQVPSPRRPSVWNRLYPRTVSVALAEALFIGLLAAVAWALLKGILELGFGLLAVAVLGGWGIGFLLRQVRASPLLAVALGTLTWVSALVLSWLLAMAILPGSSRTFIERVEGTPFLDWLSPQFGLIEILSLAMFSGAAAYGARR